MKKKLAAVCALAILAVGMVAPSHADILSADPLECLLQLTKGNTSSGFGTGNFGTVHLVADGIDTITVTISLNDGWNIIDTGFPGAVGFTDSLAGTPTIGNFSSALYSGSVASATQDQHFDGFGYFRDVAGVTAPHNGSGLQTLSFTVTQAGLNDVNYLLNYSGAPHGDGAALFVVDAGQIGGSTGLLAAVAVSEPIPEPSAVALSMLGGALVLGFAARRRQSAA